ncbi:unnamed protein product [Clavelina lepadiformis]|uniref:G-protein coupled receptors family 1 profile domain-containing protein n=1 Tax=Clavelina lepadiformis TaxID=159417 RepID=A0ABP0G9T3_CLALP
MDYSDTEIDLQLPGGQFFIPGDLIGKPPVMVWQVVLLIIICFVGLVGNLLAILVILILREYQKSVTHWYVLQLALADSLFLLTLPFKVSEELQGSWIYPQWMCKAKETILFFNYYASILFLVIMSIDRYIAVCHPFSEGLQKLRKKQSAYIITTVTWVVAILLCIPVMLYSFKIGDKPYCKCSYEFPLAPKSHEDICLEEKLQGDEFDRCLQFFNNTSRIQSEDPYCRDPQEIANVFLSLYSVPAGTDDEQDSFYGLAGLENILGGGEIDLTALEGFVPLQGEHALPTQTASRGFEKMTPDPGLSIEAQCHYWDKPVGWIAFIVFNFTAMFLVPLLVLLVCYGLILHRIFSTKIKTSHYPSSSTSNHSSNIRGGSCNEKRRKASCRSDRDRIRMTVMCVTLVSTFVLCWILFHAVHLAKINGIRVPIEQSDICVILPAVGSVLAYLNSALNPYLYSFIGTQFIKRWNLAVRRTMRRTSSSSAGNTVRFKKRANSSSNAPTAVTKLNRNLSDNNYLASEAQPTLDVTRAGYHTEVGDTQRYSTVHTMLPTVAPDAEQDLPTYDQVAHPEEVEVALYQDTQ